MKRVLMVLLLVVSAGFSAGCGDDDDVVADAAFIDAGGCAACGPTQVCVQKFNRACTITKPTCVNSSLVCPASTCTPECEREICGFVDGGTGTTCFMRQLCGGEARDAFTCYEK